MRSHTFGTTIRALALCLAATLAFAVASSATTTDTDLTSKDSGTSETGLGSLVADALRAQVKADIGWVSASELKDATIPAGEVTVQGVSKAITYQDDSVVVLTLRGEQIRRALERSVTIYPQKNLGFLQVSGLTFTFDPSKPKESRVSAVGVGGKSLDDSKSYTVAATSSLANGALGYFRVWKKDQITSVTKTSVVQAIENYLKTTSKLDYSSKRITIVK